MRKTLGDDGKELQVCQTYEEWLRYEATVQKPQEQKVTLVNISPVKTDVRSDNKEVLI